MGTRLMKFVFAILALLIYAVPGFVGFVLSQFIAGVKSGFEIGDYFTNWLHKVYGKDNGSRK